MNSVCYEALYNEIYGQYVMEDLFTEVFSQQPPEISQYLLETAILNRFCGPLCEALCVQGSEPLRREISGWEFIAWLQHIRQNFSGVAACVEKLETLNDTSPPDTPRHHG